MIKNEPMSKHISFKTGGNADYYEKATSIDDIKKTIEFLLEYKMMIKLNEKNSKYK